MVTIEGFEGGFNWRADMGFTNDTTKRFQFQIQIRFHRRAQFLNNAVFYVNTRNAYSADIGRKVLC